jgi:Icc protein
MIAALITDLHIPPDNTNPQGIPVWENFMWALEDAVSQKPDMLIINGDLCYDIGHLKTMQKIKTELLNTRIEYYVLPGNHDDSVMLCNVFDYEIINERMKPYKVKKNTTTWYFLDSADYTLPIPDLRWAIQNNSDKKMICVHHPLITGASVFMDQQHPLKNLQELQPLLSEIKEEIHFFHGHYHIEKTLCMNNMKFHITPSTYYQIDGLSAEHKISSIVPAYRLITISNKGQITTNVLYKKNLTKGLL